MKYFLNRITLLLIGEYVSALSLLYCGNVSSNWYCECIAVSQCSCRVKGNPLCYLTPWKDDLSSFESALRTIVFLCVLSVY